jgi:hypothetical protein
VVSMSAALARRVESSSQRSAIRTPPLVEKPPVPVYYLRITRRTGLRGQISFTIFCR